MKSFLQKSDISSIHGNAGLAVPFSGGRTAGGPAGTPAGKWEGPGPAILESEGIKVTFEESIHSSPIQKQSEHPFFQCVSVTCKNWMCEDCRRIKGHELRQKLIEKAAMFKEPRLYTITVNRDWFDSPKAAYQYVMRKKFIARLLTKELKVKRWIWVLEAQENSGDGWPHWHILIDVGDLPGMWYHRERQEHQNETPAELRGWCYIPHFFDLVKVHRLLRKWHVGEQCKLSEKRGAFASADHAIYYITKYLIKTPERGFPPWMLRYPRLRFYQPSYAVGSILNTGKFAAADQPEIIEDEESLDSCQDLDPRLPVDRIAECRHQVLFKFYDVQADRNRFTRPLRALKESVKQLPGAVVQNDFDFVTLRSFQTWGFNSAQGLGNFYRCWSAPDVCLALSQRIAERRGELLARWLAPEASASALEARTTPNEGAGAGPSKPPLGRRGKAMSPDSASTECNISCQGYIAPTNLMAFSP